MTLTSQLDADAEEFLGVVNDFCVSQVAPRPKRST